ncbi:hypothetical protein PENSPDRAFT_661441 [Peniophora sp. CONT]|nr:hypothetical protein PENSPDRAFT_661441 [Peniophora sp. CONT]
MTASNHKADSYARWIARAHYREFSAYLVYYLANETPGARSIAREKLARLTRQQFHELSTDVYDELVRRKENDESNDGAHQISLYVYSTSLNGCPHSVPFLPAHDDFHPKRNQARHKLGTLPPSRFKDLSSDVYYELVRRYPEVKEEELEP